MMHAPIGRALDRIVRMPEVIHLTGYSRATIYRKIKRGEFPPGIPLGANATGWHESDLAAWTAAPTDWRAAA